ncbi:hypothetical protein [Aquifex aeolicus]|uniref:hypothetical protein n=1 Tax=Aquifex aeolicus TaxID=63363 RepID=UPI00031CB9D4|nr:hypothetical protein [Aquifex aeolicus]
MDKIILSLYSGSLFTIVFIVSPVLLRTEKNKDLAGHFYGKILWNFYRIFLPVLLLYGLLFNFFEGVILFLGLGVNVFISKKLKEFKRKLGSIENLDFNHPDRVKFRKLSYTSLSVLFLNFMLSTTILYKNL